MSSVGAPEPDVPTATLRRAVTASMLGNATEWYDYSVYSYLTLEISKHFFPGPHAILATLATFAVSFVLRPLGGFVWGPLGDRFGRQKVMPITILLMCGGTFLFGVIPTYRQIGLWAPILLVALRVVQGFSTGGEYGGAATFMSEYAPDRRRGFWGSFLEFGTLGGYALAIGVVALVRAITGDAAMASWGWRVPFMVALPLGAVGLYLRLRLEDTPVFRELDSSGQTEKAATTALGELLRGYWRPILKLFALVIALNIADYTLLTYMPTYLQTTIGMTPGAALLLVAIGYVCMMVLIPFAGRLSDRIGRKPCWWISLIGLFVLAIPMFWLMGQSFALAILGFVVLGIMLLLQLGTISATFPAMFPGHVRYAGMAVSYNVATAAFGGTAAFVNAALIDATGNNLMPAFYMMFGCVIGAIGLWKVVETRGSSLRGRDLPGTTAEPDDQGRSGGIGPPPTPAT